MGSHTIRSAAADDLPRILELLQASLGWVPGEQYAAFYAWKHDANAFGRSPAWVATHDGAVVGLRVWLRWEFEDGVRTYRAVRAVDTATHPDHRGRGIFSQLTMHGLEAMRDEGVDFVFNTPNEQSRPGYLKMGWREVGRLGIAVRFSSPAALLRTARAGVPADKWSRATDAGVPAPEALADGERLQALITADRGRRTGPRMRTNVTPAFLRWRYGFAPLCYRAVEKDESLALFRLRPRGPATECVICEVLAVDDRAEQRLLREVARTGRADHTIHMTPNVPVRAGFVPLPGQGPILTWREVNEPEMPRLARWDLRMGDVELF